MKAKIQVCISFEKHFTSDHISQHFMCFDNGMAIGTQIHSFRGGVSKVFFLTVEALEASIAARVPVREAPVVVTIEPSVFLSATVISQKEKESCEECISFLEQYFDHLSNEKEDGWSDKIESVSILDFLDVRWHQIRIAIMSISTVA